MLLGFLIIVRTHRKTTGFYQQTEDIPVENLVVFAISKRMRVYPLYPSKNWFQFDLDINVDFDFDFKLKMTPLLMLLEYYSIIAYMTPPHFLAKLYRFKYETISYFIYIKGNGIMI